MGSLDRKQVREFQQLDKQTATDILKKQFLEKKSLREYKTDPSPTNTENPKIKDL